MKQKSIPMPAKFFLIMTGEDLIFSGVNPFRGVGEWSQSGAEIFRTNTHINIHTHYTTHARSHARTHNTRTHTHTQKSPGETKKIES